MKMQKLAFAAVVAAVSLISTSASAACWVVGNPTHIWTQSSYSYTTVYTYNNEYYTYFRISKSDPELLAHVRDAAAWSKTFEGLGDEASCATSGAIRYAGYLIYGYVYGG